MNLVFPHILLTLLLSGFKISICTSGLPKHDLFKFFFNLLNPSPLIFKVVPIILSSTRSAADTVATPAKSAAAYAALAVGSAP